MAIQRNNFKIYIDTETTGLDPASDAIVQVSGIIENGHETITTFDYFMRPYNGAHMSVGASAVTGLTDLDLQHYEDAGKVLDNFLSLVQEVCGTYKPLIIGYNVSFDFNFLRAWMAYYQKDIEDYFKAEPYDVLGVVREKLSRYRKEMGNLKLTTVYRSLFHEDFDSAHNSLADIIATKEALSKLQSSDDLIILTKTGRKMTIRI